MGNEDILVDKLFARSIRYGLTPPLLFIILAAVALLLHSEQSVKALAMLVVYAALLLSLAAVVNALEGLIIAGGSRYNYRTWRAYVGLILGAFVFLPLIFVIDYAAQKFFPHLHILILMVYIGFRGVVSPLLFGNYKTSSLIFTLIAGSLSFIVGLAGLVVLWIIYVWSPGWA